MNARINEYDQRLILLKDGSRLVGAAVHYRLPADPAEVEPTQFERRLDAFAVVADLQGKDLSDGRRASTTLLDAVRDDVASRHIPEDTVFLTALVAPDNIASKTALKRYGLSDRGLDEAGQFYVLACLLLRP
jgi:hypothetical protein